MIKRETGAFVRPPEDDEISTLRTAFGHVKELRPLKAALRRSSEPRRTSSPQNE